MSLAIENTDHGRHVPRQRPAGVAPAATATASWIAAACRRRWGWLAAIAWAAASPALAARPVPLQVLVPPVSGEAVVANGRDLTAPLVHAYLHARLPEVPGVTAVDEQLGDDLLFAEEIAAPSARG